MILQALERRVLDLLITFELIFVTFAVFTWLKGSERELVRCFSFPLKISVKELQVYLICRRTLLSEDRTAQISTQFIYGSKVISYDRVQLNVLSVLRLPVARLLPSFLIKCHPSKRVFKEPSLHFLIHDAID